MYQQTKLTFLSYAFEYLGTVIRLIPTISSLRNLWISRKLRLRMASILVEGNAAKARQLATDVQENSSIIFLRKTERLSC